MRDYSHIDSYISELAGDIYPQPLDSGHSGKTLELLTAVLPKLDGHTVLDVGCGQGNAAGIFSFMEWDWTGVTLGEDYDVCKEKKLNVHNCDFSFLPFADNQFDLVFARHALEHSPMPLITLMEWHRVCKKHLLLILPRIEAELVAGLNHYTLLYKVQWRALLFRAGFAVVDEDDSDILEYRMLCEKVERPKAPADYTQFIETNVYQGTDLRTHISTEPSDS